MVFPWSNSEVSNPRVFSPSQDFPGRIRVGDINIDGAGDLIFNIVPADKTQSYGSPIILFNSGTSFGYRPNADTLPFYTIYTDTNGNSNQLQTIQALSISFFDFDEIG